MANHKLSGSLPPEWTGMVNLNILVLDNNRLEGVLPWQWGSLFQVEGEEDGLPTLSLSNNRLYGSLPLAWGSMTKLQNLVVDHNSISSTLPRWSSMKYLVQLDLSYN